MKTNFFCVILFTIALFSIPSHAEEVANSEVIRNFTLIRQGWVDYRPCGEIGKTCAALGDPYRYNVYSDIDITDSALSIIQGLGFSMNPSDIIYEFKDCAELSEKYKGKTKANFNIFWTDYIALTPELLSTINLTSDDLSVNLSGSTIYQLQLLGCYYTEQDGHNRPFDNPEMATVLSNEYTTSEYSTSVILTMTAKMRKRGEKSAFIQVTSSHNPIKILDKIGGDIAKAVTEINPKTYPSDNRGYVFFRE